MGGRGGSQGGGGGFVDDMKGSTVTLFAQASFMLASEIPITMLALSSISSAFCKLSFHHVLVIDSGN